MTKIKPPLGPLIIIFINIGRKMVALHFLGFYVPVLHLLQNKAGHNSLISLILLKFLPFLIHFSPKRAPHEITNCFFYSLSTIV